MSQRPNVPARVRPNSPSRSYTSAQPVHRRVQSLGRAAPRPAQPVPPNAPQIAHSPRPSAGQRSPNKWLLLMPLAAVMVVLFSACAALTLLIGLVYAGGILPRVSAGGIDLGGMSQAEAVQALSAWDEIILTDGENEWPVNPALYGISLDFEATARDAYAQGRSEGSPFQAILGRTHIDPVVQVDLVMAAVTFEEMAPRFGTPPVNAGVTMDDGQVRPTPPQDGRRLDVAALIGVLEQDASAALADGVLELPMQRIQPEVSDSSPLVARATELLTNPLLIEAYDPIQNTSEYWSVMPQDWGRWLSAAPDASSPIGLALALNNGPLSDYLARQSSSLGGSRYLKVEDAAAMIQGVVAQGRTDTRVRVYHGDTQHVVQPGETIMSIAWDYGLPYLYIARANPGMGDFVSAGQTITIPSADNMLEFPVVFDKRIVVSMSQQRTRVYENGQLKWDWIASTGIADSPTWPGVYQVLLHDPNAYAANWNLYMPWFIGVYRPVPDAAFTNGFHGFPTRGGSQLLWTNSLGTRVTYGCILLSSDNARLLYDWAEEGIVVEIQP